VQKGKIYKAKIIILFMLIKREVLFGIVLVVVLISVFSVSAITGKAQQQDVEVSVTVGNAAPVIVQVNAPTSLTLTEDSSANIPFTFIAYDSNGINDLDDGSVSGNYLNPVNTPNNYDTTRIGVCSVNAGDDSLDGTAYGYPGEFVRRYSCDVDMMYYDDAITDSWTIEVLISDQGALSDSDSSVTFAPNEMNGFKVSTAVLSWPVLATGSTGVPASNSITVFNTGNAYFDGSSDAYRLKFTGANLYGATDNTNFISGSNFQVNTDNPIPDCTTGVVGERLELQHLVQGIKQTIILNNEDNAQADEAEDELYFCLAQLDLGISAQDYATTVVGSGESQAYPWEISM